MQLNGQWKILSPSHIIQFLFLLLLLFQVFIALLYSQIWMHKEKWVSLLVLTMLGRPHRPTFCLSARLKTCFVFFKHHIFHSMEKGGGIQGHRDFWFPPRESRSYEAAPEGQNRILPEEGAIVDPRLHFCASPVPFHQGSIFLSLCRLRAYETIGAHLCSQENSLALCKAVLFSTRSWQSVFLKAIGAPLQTVSNPPTYKKKKNTACKSCWDVPF